MPPSVEAGVVNDVWPTVAMSDEPLDELAAVIEELEGAAGAEPTFTVNGRTM